VVLEYFGDDAAEVMSVYPPVPSPKLAFQTLNTHLCVTCPTKVLANIVGNKWPVYLYEFSWNSMEPGYAGHGSEIPEVFGYSVFPWPFNRELSSVMIDYWTSFSRSGIPESSNGVVWPKYRDQNIFVRFDDNVERESGFHDKECGFWQTYGNTPEKIQKMGEYCFQTKFNSK